MCGISGIFNFNGAPVDPAVISSMSAALEHRGPDGSGSFVSGEIGLGHRRLSIIDLTSGAQPMTNEDGAIQIVFNGEIYNFVELRRELENRGHVFKTRSDTEVIIHGYEEWGLECPKKLNGIFAFALWDGNRRRLLLARDHLGVKPLYFAVVGKRLLFASEIKALLLDRECPRAVDLRSMAQLFTLRYVPSPSTIFRGISKLPPGHLLLATSTGIEVRRYWEWTPQIREGRTENALIEEYQALVEDAVRIQMRSDVPVGLFLSSGIDSASLLALMRQHSPQPIHTFTIGFAGGDKSNETSDARNIARHFGADHDEMTVSPGDYQHYYQRYLWDLEEPVGNETAAAFYFVSMIARKKVKVVLSGQGADEPWAGYHRYLGVKLSQIYSRLPRVLTEKLLRNLFEPVTKNEKLKRGLIALPERDLLARFVKIYSFYSTGMKERLFQPWVKEQIMPNGHEAREALRSLQADVRALDPLTQMLYIDTRANLPDDLLMVGDKTAMANSVEARVPYLDYRIVEFIETLPSNLKLRGFTGKYLHKKAIEKWIPQEWIYVKKKGFANPIDEWMRASMKHYLEECLLSDRSALKQYFDSGYIRTLLREHEAGRQNYLRQLYLLISFELWHRTFLPA